MNCLKQNFKESKQDNHDFLEQCTPLSISEAAKHLDISISYLYKLTSQSQIPHYKPNGKKIYFLKSDLNKWMLRNRVTSEDELDQKATDYVTQGVKL